MHLALVALDVGPGDEVITSPITWPATANVIEHCGATPVFCDVREGDLNLDPALLAAARHRADEGDPPRPPRRAAVRPRPDPRARAPGRRGRGARAREPLPRPQARRALGRDGFSLYATKNLAAGEGGLVATNRDDVADRIREHAPDAPRRRLALRPGDGRLQGEPLRRPRGDRARPARQARAPRRDPGAAVRALRRRRSPDLDGITPLARDPRDTHAHAPLRRADRRRAAPARRATSTSGSFATSGSRRAIHFLPVHRLTWFRERYPAQPPLPVAERAGDEVLSLPLSPAHSDDDIRDAIDAIRRVHARLA